MARGARRAAIAAIMVLVMMGIGTRMAGAQALPAANAGGPYAGVRGAPIAFSGGDSTGTGLVFAWNFGDGGYGEGVMPTHIYGSTGTFTVRLTVTDFFGRTATATTTSTVGIGSAVISLGPACLLTPFGIVCGGPYSPYIVPLFPGLFP